MPESIISQSLERRPDMSQKHKLVLGFSLILALALLLWGILSYSLRPIPYRQSISACTLDGDVINLELNVTLHRKLWNPMELHGKIIIDGTEYVSYSDLYPGTPIEGAAGDIHFFCIPGDNLMDTMEQDRLIIMPIENKLDCFWFCFVQSGESYTYFCPAKSQAQAQEIADQLTADD